MRRIIEFLKKLGNWLFRIFRWLINEFKLIWITLLPILVGVIFCLFIPTSIFNGPILCDTLESRFRLTGLILEVLGIGTVVYGLIKNLKLFERTHLLGIIIEKFKRFPKFKKHHHTLSASLISSIANVSGNLSVRVSPASNAPIEDRVAYLEEQIKQVQSQAFDNKALFEKKLKKLSDDFADDSLKRDIDDEKAKQDFKEYVVGDAYIELMGIIWLIIGAISATASTELAKAFWLIFGAINFSTHYN